MFWLFSKFDLLESPCSEGDLYKSGLTEIYLQRLAAAPQGLKVNLIPSACKTENRPQNYSPIMLHEKLAFIL